MIIAMAGHVDHGKTSLIRALTGIDPDRLPDEKQRGMTIDLGFAHLVLPGGELVGFVDVPGHERFLGNMLAGVLSVDTALLVVAADDGPMPQTEEHLSILRLTGVTDLAVAITKIDRVSTDDLATMTEKIRARVTLAGFADAPLMPVSSHTGQGMSALQAFLSQKATAWRPRSATGGFRLAVDRAFVVAGTGVVVTGTVVAGSVAVGDRLMLSPARLAARVRGVQRHHQATTTAQAGDRCALAVGGPQIQRGRINRGDWLIAQHLHAPTARLDVQVEVAAEQTVRHGSRIHAHIGAASIPGRALVVGPDDLSPGETGFVSLTLERPTAAAFSDRIVLRDAGTGRVIGGGIVIDPSPPVRRTRREIRLITLQALAQADDSTAMASLLASDGWIDVGRLALSRNTDTATLIDRAAELPARRVGPQARPVLLSDRTRDDIQTLLQTRLEKWHRDYPDLPGPSQAALLAAIPAVPPELTEAVLSDMLTHDVIARQGRSLALPGHSPTLSPDDRALWEKVESVLDDAGLRPPRVRELAAHIGLDPDSTDQRLSRLERFGLLIRVAPNRFFLPRTVVALGELAAALANESEAAGFTAGIFSQRSGIGRNLTIQVLEYLDRIGVTRRDGEYRHVHRDIGTVLA